MEALRALARSRAGLVVVCQGSSMEPTLRAGDQVTVRAGGRIVAGDVVLLENGAASGTILHRVITLLPGTPWFVHCGDAGGRNGAGVARIARIIGRADLPRRRPGPGSQLAAALAVLRYARARLTGR